LLNGAAERISADGLVYSAGGLVDARGCISNIAGRVTVAIVWRGFHELANYEGSDCGVSSGLYGVDNLQRRVLVMTTYVASR